MISCISGHSGFNVLSFYLYSVPSLPIVQILKAIGRTINTSFSIVPNTSLNMPTTNHFHRNVVISKSVVASTKPVTHYHTHTHYNSNCQRPPGPQETRPPTGFSTSHMPQPSSTYPRTPPFESVPGPLSPHQRSYTLPPLSFADSSPGPPQVPRRTSTLLPPLTQSPPGLPNPRSDFPAYNAEAPGVIYYSFQVIFDTPLQVLSTLINEDRCRSKATVLFHSDQWAILYTTSLFLNTMRVDV